MLELDYWKARGYKIYEVAENGVYMVNNNKEEIFVFLPTKDIFEIEKEMKQLSLIAF